MLSVIDRSTNISDWRDAPSIQKAIDEVRKATEPDVSASLQQAASDASSALAQAEARVSVGLASASDVAAAREKLADARQAMTEHEDRVSRNSERVAAVKVVAAQVITAAQQATAQEVYARELACAKKTVAAVRKLLTEIEAFEAAYQYERNYFGTAMHMPPDPIGQSVLPVGCYLPPGTQMPIVFGAGQGYDAVAYMRDWLRRMEERGLA